jgi:hypothetical protein
MAANSPKSFFITDNISCLLKQHYRYTRGIGNAASIPIPIANERQNK